MHIQAANGYVYIYYTCSTFRHLMELYILSAVNGYLYRVPSPWWPTQAFIYIVYEGKSVHHAL